uniref:Uncharacterized protein n=1 Tax=Anopheles maculatus TaxID=74869 RepID=A0A182T6P2_9DIPT
MADVVSSPRRLATTSEEESHQQLLHAACSSRMRRRKTTDEVIEEMEPLESYDRVHDPTQPDADDDGHVLQQREKEPKKDGLESSPYRYDEDHGEQGERVLLSGGNHDREGKLQTIDTSIAMEI